MTGRVAAATSLETVCVAYILPFRMPCRQICGSKCLLSRWELRKDLPVGVNADGRRTKPLSVGVQLRWDARGGQLAELSPEGTRLTWQ